MITLEKIDQVVERTGVSYEKAKEALELNNGDVVEAIIAIQKENEHDTASKGAKASDILDTLKDFIRKGNISRIIISDKENTLLNIPVTVGAVGIVLAPVVAILGAGAALVSNLNVSILDFNGRIIDVSKETSERLDFLKKKGEKVMDSAEKAAEDIKEKFSKKNSEAETEDVEFNEDFSAQEDVDVEVEIKDQEQ